jgi:8-amino-7-oxononanoate synthase
VSFTSEIKQELEQLRKAELERSPRTICGPQQPEIVVNGAPVIGLCSNNYLGLANHPSLIAAASEALKLFGFGAGASRHICGTMKLHRTAEQRLSRFVGAEAALLFSTGYAANVGTIQALVGASDVVFSDSLNHASIIDGCRLSRARILVYRHRDLEHLEELLSKHRESGSRALVISEAVFSMDGDLAPLSQLRTLCDRFDAALMVDEAHSLGVMGPCGKGLCEARQVKPEVLLGTLGKAFGAAGAFIAGSSDVVKIVENRARSFVFSTAPPPAQAAAAVAATDLVEAADDRRKRLLSYAERLRSSLREFGFSIPECETPIIPLYVGSPDTVMKLSSDLLERGVFVHGIRPPSVAPGTCRLRITPIATLEEDHISLIINAFKSLAPEYGSTT